MKTRNFDKLPSYIWSFYFLRQDPLHSSIGCITKNHLRNEWDGCGLAVVFVDDLGNSGD